MSVEQGYGVVGMQKIYDRYVKPVEQEHLGEFVLVTPDGEMIFATDSSELVRKTEHVTGEGNCIFRVGHKAAFSIL